MKVNIWLGALRAGCISASVSRPAPGQLRRSIERVSRSSAFEYGKARMFGCLGWGLCASAAGMLFNVNPAMVFWMGSGAALVLMGLLFIARPRVNPTAQVMNALARTSRR